jgi:hypothetical protein
MAVTLLVATLALADNNVINQGTYYKNAQSGAKVDANGNAYTNEAAKDRDRVIKYDSIIDDTCAVGMADSTAVPIDVHDAARGYLYIRCLVPAGFAPAVTRWAVRVQGCLNAATDSTSKYNFALSDSGQVGTASVPVVYGSGAVQPSVTSATSTGEFVVVIPADAASATRWGRTNTLIVPLKDQSGNWLWAENITVLVRNLNSGSTGGTARITVSYRGVPL